jgi:hypothetical protein
VATSQRSHDSDAFAFEVNPVASYPVVTQPLGKQFHLRLTPSLVTSVGDCSHYRPFDEHVKLCDGPDIYMPTEFLHGLYDGGAGAGLADYWDAILKGKASAGGFIWSLVDECVKRPDTGKMDGYGNYAPDGIVGPFREKEASFYTVKELWSPIVVKRVGDGFEVENRYAFTDAKECTFTWQLRKFAGPFASGGSPHEVVGEWKQPFELASGERRAMKMEMPPGTEKADALSLRIDDPTGHELWTWVWQLRELQRPPMKQSRPVATDMDSAIEVEAGNVRLTFSKRTGQLTRVTRGEMPLSLANGPRLAIGESKLESITQKGDDNGVIIDAKFSGDMQRATWRVNPDGWVDLDYSYALTGDHDFFGVCFDLPERDVKSMRWLGEGPHRLWKNRLDGTTLGVWENPINDTVTGHSGWKYPEFRGVYAGVRWMRLDTTNGPIVVAPDDPALFVQVLSPKFPEGEGPPNPNSTRPSRPSTQPSLGLARYARAKLPDAGLSILHAIPPIGNKFHRADQTGPQGQLNHANGEYRARVRFFFGDAPSTKQ